MSEIKEEPITLAYVKAQGGELVSEEKVEDAIDGGYWNIYAQTWATADGREFTFDCQGDDFSGIREEYEWVD